MFEREVGDFEKNNFPVSILVPKKKYSHPFCGPNKNMLHAEKISCIPHIPRKKFLVNESVKSNPERNHPPPSKDNWSTPTISALNKISPEKKVHGILREGRHAGNEQTKILTVESSMNPWK